MASELSGSAHELPRTPRNSTIIRKVILYINATPATRRGTRSARGLLDHYALELVFLLLEPAGDGATADTGHGAFIPIS